MLRDNIHGLFNCVDDAHQVSRYEYVKNIIELFKLPSQVNVASEGIYKRLAPVSKNEFAVNYKLRLLVKNVMRCWKTSLEDCLKATKDIDYVLHQAALGSVPRSIKNPITSNDVNVGGFLNMLVASRDNGVKRFVFASSSSTYGDSESMPKVEDIIGKPLSPYAITKYVNELYADIFSKIYGLETIGLRYFNVFGRKQDPNGAYASVIPKFVSQLMKGEPPVINGDGNYSRDFTYIDNVIQANLLSLVTTNEKAINTLYNVAYGDRNTLNDLMGYLKKYLSDFDSKILNIEVIYGPNRAGDIPHSHASVAKAKEN